jgi:hypothetical protein
MHGPHTSPFTRWSTVARRAVTGIGRVRALRERRRLGLAAMLTLALIGQLVVGPIAEAHPCNTAMADCEHCPHMTIALRLADRHTDAPGPTLPVDCLMDRAGVCSGVQAPAIATVVMSGILPVPRALDACEPSLPPLDDPPFELLRPPKP